jgi:hypothetical protein
MTRLPPLTPLLLLILVPCGGCYVVNNKPLTSRQKADQLANGVMAASGANTWGNVRSVAFTFVVREGSDVKVSRAHYWNLRENTDTVTIGDKSTTIKLGEVDPNDPLQADAFKAWTNDSYWLLAPLKLFDGGVSRDYLGRKEIMGKSYETLQLSFEGVGLTPGDRYNLYVDPYTSLVAFWDYMPDPDRTMLATWEQYRHMQGLKLSTFHQMGTRTITMENLRVVAD